MTPTDIVIDTNVVLDWLVFEHASAHPLRQGIESGQLRWLATPEMRDELLDVLGRTRTLPTLMRWAHRHDAAVAQAVRWATPVPAPAPLSLALRLRCTDPDDQCFIDLALARRIPWLLTRDRALLRLASRAGRHGVRVCTPERWALLRAGG
jgi:predicted nucleic acid-binding protein